MVRIKGKEYAAVGYLPDWSRRLMIGNEPPRIICDTRHSQDCPLAGDSKLLDSQIVRSELSLRSACNSGIFLAGKKFQGPRAEANQAAATNGELANSVHPSAIRESSRGGPLIVNPIGELMTADEVAEYLRVNRTRIYRLLKRKELPAFKVGTDFRLRRVDVVEWIIKKEQAAWMHRVRL